MSKPRNINKMPVILNQKRTVECFMSSLLILATWVFSERYFLHQKKSSMLNPEVHGETTCLSPISLYFSLFRLEEVEVYKKKALYKERNTRNVLHKGRPSGVDLSIPSYPMICRALSGPQQQMYMVRLHTICAGISPKSSYAFTSHCIIYIQQAHLMIHSNHSHTRGTTHDRHWISGFAPTEWNGTMDRKSFFSLM